MRMIPKRDIYPKYLLYAVRDQKSKDTKELESKNQNNGVGKGQGVTKDSLQNSDLLTSTIEETEDVDLKFFDAVPELEKLRIMNGTDHDAETLKNITRVRLRRRRRRKTSVVTTKLVTSPSRKRKSKCQVPF